MDKVVRDGKVAVLISPDYGGGWSTWNKDYPQCLFDPEVVAWVEGGKKDPLPDFSGKYSGYFFDGGAQDLCIVWVRQGQKFRIEEYDGHESLVLEENYNWFTA